MDHEDRRKPMASTHKVLGVIKCPECSTAWTKEFVPEFCTRCGTRVSDVPGEGFEWMVRLFEKVGASAPITVCPHCGERYPGRPTVKQCLRCWHDLYPERPPSPVHRVWAGLKRMVGLRG